MIVVCDSDTQLKVKKTQWTAIRLYNTLGLSGRMGVPEVLKTNKQTNKQTNQHGTVTVEHTSTYWYSTTVTTRYTSTSSLPQS